MPRKRADDDNRYTPAGDLEDESTLREVLMEEKEEDDPELQEPLETDDDDADGDADPDEDLPDEEFN